MPFKPSSLRLRGWDGEHPALFGFSGNSPSYRCRPSAGVGVRNARRTGAIQVVFEDGAGSRRRMPWNQNAAPAVRIDEIGAVAFCQ